MKTSKRFGIWLIPLLSLAFLGCEKPVVETGPSYSELVVTYNAELAALDRLETKREKLVQDYAAASAPAPSGDNLSDLEGLLQSAKELKDGTQVDTTSDPNEMLDKLTEQAGEAEALAGKMLDGLLSGDSNAEKPAPTPEELAAAAERKAAFESEVAQLDAEIAKQKERVERARQARDAAEEEE